MLIIVFDLKENEPGNENYSAVVDALEQSIFRFIKIRKILIASPENAPSLKSGNSYLI